MLSNRSQFRARIGYEMSQTKCNSEPTTNREDKSTRWPHRQGCDHTPTSQQRENQIVLRRSVRFCCGPIRWVWRFGLGGNGRVEKLLRRSWLTVFLLIIVGLPLGWFVLFAQFHLVQPANTYDWVAQVNSETETIATEDRAWPLYESGFKALSRTAYAIGWDPETGCRFFVRDEDLRGHFEFATDTTRERNAKVAATNATAIAKFIEASNKPQLGCVLSSDLEDRLDGSMFPVLWPMPPQAHAVQAASEVLRHAFLAAAEDGDSQRVVDLAVARRRVAGHYSQLGPWRFSSVWANRMLTETARDVCFFMVQKPDLFSKSDLEELTECFKEQRGFESHPELAKQVIENMLGQCYTADGAPCGRLVELMQTDYAQRYGGSGLTRQQQRFLAPKGAKERVMSFFARPVLVKLMPTREELRKQLELQVEEASQIADRKPWQDRLDRVNRRVARLSAFPDWKDLPAFLFNAEIFEVRAPATEVRLSTTRLLIALEQHRRGTGNWPESLADFKELVPNDPYADQPVQYRVENGKPIIWSVGEDGADNGGKSLSTSAGYAGHDWQLVPQQDPRYLDWVRKNQ